MKGNVYIHTYNGCKEINHEGCLEDDMDSRNGEYSVSCNPNHENVIYTPCDRGKSTPMVKRNQKKTKLFLSPPQSKQSSLFLTQDLVLFFSENEASYCNQRGQLVAAPNEEHPKLLMMQRKVWRRVMTEPIVCPEGVQSGIQTAWIVTSSRMTGLPAHNVLEPTLLWIGLVKMGTLDTSMNYT